MTSALVSKQTLAAAVSQIRAAIGDASLAAEVAVQKALRVGTLLIETKPMLGHSNFQEWIEKTFPELPYRTAARWMDFAQKVVTHVGIQPALLPAPMSEIITAAPESLSEPAREARQLLLDFTKDKTIAECLRAVVVDGDEPHRITRAHNGKSKGGHNGKDRKDWPTFVRRKLSDITSHLKFWQTMSGAQTEAIIGFFKGAVAAWPSPLLEALKKLIADELKNR